MIIFNGTWVPKVFQLISATLVVCFAIVVILIFSKPEEVTTIPFTDGTGQIIIDDPKAPAAVTDEREIEFISSLIADSVISFQMDTPTNIVIEGPPRIVTKTVTPSVTIDFGGDEVTYSGDLPVSEAAKIFFDALMGYVKEARECKDATRND